MTWSLDSTHMEVGFAVKHLMVSTVKGRFTDVDAEIHIDEEDVNASRVVARIHTASIETGNPDRDAHLRSPDFLNAEQYPVMTFKSTEVARVGNDRFRLAGDLTIRDVTRPVVLEGRAEGPVADPWGGRRAGFTLSGELDREAFGLGWNMALEAGGVVVGRQVRLSIEAELVQDAAAAA